MTYNEWEKTFVSESEEGKNYLYKDTVINSKIINSAAYRNSFNAVSDNTNVQRSVYQSAKEMLEHRSGTRYEDLAFIDSRTGKSMINKNYSVKSTAAMSKKMQKMLSGSEPYTIIGIHNHPGSSVPSIPDLKVCQERKYKFGMVVGHNGSIYKYSVSETNFDETLAKMGLDKLENGFYNADVEKIFHDSGVQIEVL